MTGTADHAKAVELAETHGAYAQYVNGEFDAIFFDPCIRIAATVGSPELRVSWYDANDREATETFTSPMAAVERAIELQKESA